ncbi:MULTISPECIES: cytochrome c biogenesis heme-transporting ATPase CcmA [Methylotenera]|uniref:cytochrome c biogenesis heme-transporting ATPase CcmA n=1 Tax=Methylotenera TaxID=359407 RepID=UPI00036EAA14|nr:MULTISPECIES: cytochrome c biogenesis heme-transporting ATPase CcmA [Methylotenera]
MSSTQNVSLTQHLTTQNLVTQNISCVRGDRILFKEVNLHLQAGSLLYILGENGTGKSSLLRVLTGLLQPESGVVLWNERNIQRRAEAFQSQLLYIGHLNAIKEDLSAHENLLFSSNINQQEIQSNLASNQVLQALQAVGLQRQAYLPTRYLSQGQKRRVALARLWLDAIATSVANIHTPAKLWILDEPFASLDTEMSGLLAGRISQHLAKGGMVILTTHQPVDIASDDIQIYRLH